MLRIKQIGTICFTIFLLIFPAFATNPDIDTATASCNDGVFNSNTGPVNIEINWEPNEINLRWYNNNTLITPSNNASNTCTYDENDLTIPAAPTRTGYTFRGWRARPQYDFSTLSVSAGGQEKWSKGRVGSADQCRYKLGNGSANIVSCGEPVFSELQRYEFKIRFVWGNIYGMALCASETCEGGSYSNITDCSVWAGTDDALESNSGQKCWCKVTGYEPDGSNIKHSPTVAPKYIFGIDYGSSGCYYGCPELCMNAVAHYRAFRTVAFGVSQ